MTAEIPRPGVLAMLCKKDLPGSTARNRRRRKARSGGHLPYSTPLRAGLAKMSRQAGFATIVPRPIFFELRMK